VRSGSPTGSTAVRGSSRRSTTARITHYGPSRKSINLNKGKPTMSNEPVTRPSDDPRPDPTGEPVTRPTNDPRPDPKGPPVTPPAEPAKEA